VSSLRLERQEFRAMGTSCALAVTARSLEEEAARRALEVGQAEVRACERALSRFDAASDLSRLNAAAGEWTAVDGRLLAALALALHAREQTDGRFDPTILPVLDALGYDRSFEQLLNRPPRDAPDWKPSSRIDLDLAGGRARLERGTAVDLGGIGKGFAADRAIAAMRAAWPELPGALVDLGGDIAVWGTSPENGPWLVAVADPRRPSSTLGTLTLQEGGIATSGRDQRRFGPERRLHHLIDPAAAAPACIGPLAVTVVAADAATAEVHATALSLIDPGDARAYLHSRPHLAAILVPEAGAPAPIGAPAFVRSIDLKGAGSVTRIALRIGGVAAVLAAGALASGCGGSSGKESAASFAKRITTEFSRGQSGRLWTDLLPAQQAVVTKARFLACEGNEGFGLQKIKVLETYDEAVEVDGRTESSKAVSLQVTSDNGRTTATMHAITVDGRWRWILKPADLAAYKSGKCP
jgi:thiamine biosynthesis lipoprotein